MPGSSINYPGKKAASTQAHTTGTGGTSSAGSTGATSSSAKGAPAQGSKLYNDQFSVATDQGKLAKLIATPTSDWHDISAAQSQFDNDLTAYQADLKSDSAAQKAAAAALPTGAPGSAALESKEAAGAAAAWDDKQAGALKTTYKQTLFADSGSAAGVTGRVSGTSFPGGDQGTSFDGANLPSGYVSPPKLTGSQSVADAYQNMTPAQAAYTGWALAQSEAGKQIAIPPEDAQAWNAITSYAAQNNAYVKQKAGYPDDSAPHDVDNQVATALQGNKPTDVGAIVGQAIGGVVGGFIGVVPGAELLGLAGDLVGISADAAATAAETAAGAAAREAAESGAVKATADSSSTLLTNHNDLGQK